MLLNPPFFARHMEKLVPMLERLFAAARQRGDGAGENESEPVACTPPRLPRVTALVVVPAAGERRLCELPHIAALLGSPYTRGHAVIPAEEHSYCHGLAHRRTRRPQLTMRSKYDTAVYVLSTHAEPPTPKRDYCSLLSAVQLAFRAPPSSHLRRTGLARRRAPRNRR